MPYMDFLINQNFILWGMIALKLSDLHIRILWHTGMYVNLFKNKMKVKIEV